jgi:predicted TIM-barrel fold metal-dependent hydrolase
MTYQGNLVIDMDSHVREAWDSERIYPGYIDREYRETYQRFADAAQALRTRTGDVGWDKLLWPRRLRPLGVYEEFDVPRKAEERVRKPSVTHVGSDIDPAVNWDPSLRLRDMDVAGIDVAAIFSSYASGFCNLRDVGFESALHRAYSRFMSDYCAEADDRLLWIANANMRDIPESIRELRHWSTNDPHFAGMYLGRACPDGRLLDNPDLHPLFAASQEHDLPIWVHGDEGIPPLTPPARSLNDTAFSRNVLQGWGSMAAATGLIGGGVFDLFPSLRVGLFETSAGWMPWFIEQLDESYVPGSTATPNLKRKPSEIVAGGQLFCGIEPGEKGIANCIEQLGDDIWLFETDYPHHGTEWPGSAPLVTELTNISEQAKVKLLGENAKRFLRQYRS